MGVDWLVLMEDGFENYLKEGSWVWGSLDNGKIGSYGHIGCNSYTKCLTYNFLSH